MKQLSHDMRNSAFVSNLDSGRFCDHSVCILGGIIIWRGKGPFGQGDGNIIHHAFKPHGAFCFSVKNWYCQTLGLVLRLRVGFVLPLSQEQQEQQQEEQEQQEQEPQIF